MSDAKTIYFPAVTLSASEKGTVNTILYRYSLPMNGLSYTCGQAIVSTWKSEFLRPEFNSTNIQNTYTTGIPGIGIRVKWPESRGQNAWIPGSYSCTGYCMEQPDNIIIEFIQTGTIRSGILQAGELAKISLFANNNPQDSILMMNINIGQVDVNVRSCSIYASNNSINLGDYVLTDVKKNGFQGEMKDFSITLDCPERSSAKIQFDGTNPWGMSGGTLVSNGTAKYAYTRLYSKLGSRYKELTLNSLISFGSVATFTGSRQVEYAAQMYFDDSNRSAVTAGNVNSSVVYTLSID
ncbi:fimbrial protein [Tatumella ptyseos]|uniref:fimbrial protein n=1 Tax=Tatumella ptyseos TaxID=82987 RepID=UPI0026E9C498|nr:fimbrial protein [Tatumella ptyseos]WKX27345.1 fimbrial protein [Tatumella ptyseos]